MHSAVSFIQPWYLFLPSFIFAVSQIAPWGRRFQVPAFVVLVTAGWVSLVWLYSLPMALLSLAGGIVVSLLLAFLNLTNRGLTLLLGLALSTLPLGAWLYPFAGLILAGLLSVVVLLRSNGVNHVKYTTWETLAAVGWDGGGIHKPSLGRLPTDLELKTSGEDNRDGPLASKEGRRVKTPPRISVYFTIALVLLLGACLGIFGFSG